jgi:hypothetical protein
MLIMESVHVKYVSVVAIVVAVAGALAPAASSAQDRSSRPSETSSGRADLVESVGCLTAGPGNTWILTSATEPTVSKFPYTNAAALKDAETRALGTQRLTLVGPGPFNPDAHKGHKMAVKGLLIKDPKGNRLNVTSLEMVAAACK